MQRRFRIGTRGSPLALTQAQQVAERLAALFGAPAAEITEIFVISTQGDRVQDRNLSEIGGKGLFTQEIEEALADKRLDIAVHSMKDMPTVLPQGLVIDCMLERVDPRDAFLSRKARTLAELPQGAVFGTSSLRRAAQILARRPDIRIVPFRGNVETRLRKLDEGVADATMLAMAGLKRLGLEDKAASPMPVDEMLPAVAQGAIGIERRADDTEMAEILSRLHHAETGMRVAAERALLTVLEGSCRTPIAALAEIADGVLSLRGMILTPDGSEVLETTRKGDASNAEALGAEAGAELKSRAGPHFFKGI